MRPALLGYTYLAAVMAVSYLIGTAFPDHWRCSAWLGIMVVLLILSMGIFTVLMRYTR